MRSGQPITQSPSISLRGMLNPNLLLTSANPAYGEDAVVDSIRTPAEVEALRGRGDFVLIEVRADEEARWQRMTARGRSGDPVEKEAFLSQEAAEIKSQDEAGQALDATAAMADITVLNDGSIEDLEGKLEEIWSGLQVS